MMLPMLIALPWLLTVSVVLALCRVAGSGDERDGEAR